MADAAISALTAITGSGLADDDIFVVVDTDAGQTKRITHAELFKNTPNVGVNATSLNVGSYGASITVNAASAASTGVELTEAGAVRGYLSAAASGASVSLFAGASVPLLFGTNGTEVARFNTSGVFMVGNTDPNPAGNNVVGAAIANIGCIYASVDADRSGAFNRKTDDGTIITIHQDGTQEGTISVSGTTVSYNGGHLARYSRLLDGSKPEILKGTVMSNLDEMVQWGGEDNEQLNHVKVSDIDTDKNVAGVFVAWDSDDDWNDFHLAMTGDMVIRIADGVTVNRGDLLVSAGDGTAKPQGDDIVRSSTIAKVTSTEKGVTYADGSYCVPCVLMGC